MVNRQKVAKLETARMHLLELSDSGIIGINTAIQQLNMEGFKLKKEIVSTKHNGVIKQKNRIKNGKEISYWWAEIPIDGGRYKQITATTEERLIDKLYLHYCASNASIVTLADAYLEWHRQREYDAKVLHTIAGRTWDDDADSWRRFWQESDLANMKVRAITTRDIMQECKRLTGAGNITNKAFNKGMNVLNLIFDMLVDEGIVDLNPARQVPRKRLKFKPVGDKTGQYYSREDRDKLLQYLHDLPKKTVYSLGVALVACLGKRIGEVRALTWEDVDWENRLLSISHQMILDYKDGQRTHVDAAHLKAYQQGQKIPLTDYALVVLKQLFVLNGGKRYILNSKGQHPIETGHFNTKLKGFCLAAGVPYYPSHKFRFAVAAGLFDEGVDEHKIMTYLNHSDVEMTRYYDRRVRRGIDHVTAEIVLGFTPCKSQVVTSKEA